LVEVHEITPLGIINFIISLVIDTIFVTLFPHIKIKNESSNLTGNPVPFNVATIPPLAPEDNGRIEVIDKDIGILLTKSVFT
jgi:hypothetical protein